MNQEIPKLLIVSDTAPPHISGVTRKLQILNDLQNFNVDTVCYTDFFFNTLLNNLPLCIPNPFHIYQKGLNLNMQSPEFYPLVIRTASQANQLENLGDRWNRYYQMHPDNTVLKHYLIAVYHRLGQNEKAQTLINQVNK